MCGGRGGGVAKMAYRREVGVVSGPEGAHGGADPPMQCQAQLQI